MKSSGLGCSKRRIASTIRKMAAFRLCVCVTLTILVLAAISASAQTVDYYAGNDSAGFSVGVYTVDTPQGPGLYGFGLTGNRYCNGMSIPGATLGGNIDGTEIYPFIDNRATFAELRPDFFVNADLRLRQKDSIEGSATFKQAIFTGPGFPPADRDTSSCTTRKLTFKATYVGSTTLSKRAAASIVAPSSP